MRILLDTHILLWVLGDRHRLDAATLATIASDEHDVLFSAASIWEIAIKSALQRVDFGVRPADILDAALDAGFTELAVLAAIACRAAELPLIHRDPFDRILIAQAMGEPAVLFTADAALASYSELVMPRRGAGTMTVTLRRPQTGDIKVMQDGWCWSCFLFSGILGLPLFRRGLQVWGAAMVAFNIVLLIVALIPTEDADTLYTWLSLIGLGLCLFLGARANQMAIDRHLAQGWEITTPGRNRFLA